MTPEELLASLERDVLAVRREGDRLMVSPSSSITQEQGDAIRQHKDGLLLVLTVREAMERFRATMGEDDLPEGEPVRLVEKVVLSWPTGEALAFDRETVEWWERHNREAAARREQTEHRTARKKPNRS